jgi:hypothetical protein
MTLDFFSAGRFTNYSKLVEWDGTNHEEIAAWAASVEPWETNPDYQWHVGAVSSTSVTFVREVDPAVIPAGWEHRYEVTVPLGHWVSVTSEPSPDSHPRVRWMGSVAPDGLWRTSDPEGRPERLEDLLAPGSGGPSAVETLRPNAVSDRNQHAVTGSSAVAAVSDSSDSTYLRNNTGGTLEDRFHLAAPAVITSGATITGVDVRFRARTETDPGSAGIAVGLRLGTVTSLAPTQNSIPTAATDYVRAGIARPGGGSWVFADLADLQVVVLSNDGSASAVRVYDLAVDVHY